MKSLTSQEIDIQDARDLLDDEITKTCALLEVLSVLRVAPIGGESIDLDRSTLDGLNLLSQELRDNLHCRFEEFVAVGRDAAAREVSAAR